MGTCVKPGVEPERCPVRGRVGPTSRRLPPGVSWALPLWVEETGALSAYGDAGCAVGGARWGAPGGDGAELSVGGDAVQGIAGDAGRGRAALIKAGDHVADVRACTWPRSLQLGVRRHVRGWRIDRDARR
jgi:hypothetical protein